MKIIAKYTTTVRCILLEHSHGTVETTAVSIENTARQHLAASLLIRIGAPDYFFVTTIIICRSHRLQIIWSDWIDFKWNFLPALVLVPRTIRVDDNKASYVDNRKWNLLIHTHHTPIPVTYFAVNLASEFKILELLWCWMWLNDNTFLVSNTNITDRQFCGEADNTDQENQSKMFMLSTKGKYCEQMLLKWFNLQEALRCQTREGATPQGLIFETVPSFSIFDQFMNSVN